VTATLLSFVPAYIGLDTFAVVTTEANDAMRPLHDRMPSVVLPEYYALWLIKDANPELVRLLLVPRPSAMLRMHPLATAIGNVRGEGPGLIAPPRE
jgi:putative SOS response-associated peptidase YedK